MPQWRVRALSFTCRTRPPVLGRGGGGRAQRALLQGIDLPGVASIGMSISDPRVAHLEGPSPVPGAERRHRYLADA